MNIAKKLMLILFSIMFFISTWNPVQAATTSGYPYTRFEADFYADNYKIYTETSYARNFYQGLSEDESFMTAVAAWEALHIAVEPSYSLESGMITMRDYYRTALFDLLCVHETTAASTYFEKLYEELNNEYTSYMILCTKEIMGREDISPTELKTLCLTPERERLLLEGNGLGQTAEVADIVSQILKGAKSMYDAISLVSKYRALTDLNDGTIEVLQCIAANTNNEYDLRLAAIDCIAAFEDGYQESIRTMMIGTSSVIEDIIGIFVDAAWESLVLQIPGANVVFIAVKGVRAVTNLFTNNDKKIEAFYRIKASVLMEDALLRAIGTTKSIHCSVRTEKTSVIYMRAIRMYQSVVLLGFDYSENILNITGNSLTSIIFGTDDDAAQLIADIQALKKAKLKNIVDFDKIVQDAYKTQYGSDDASILDALAKKPVVDFSYTINADSSSATIISYTGNSTQVKIPELINGYVVTVVGNGSAVFGDNVTSVYIPSSVTRIEDKAFYDCDGLTDIVISNGVITIGSKAFSNCNDLVNITIPQTVTLIESQAFYGTNITNVFISSIYSWCLIEMDDSSANPLSNAINLYVDNQYATQVIIPNGITTVKQYAFYGFEGIQSVVLRESVETVEKSAFSHCSGITDVSLSSNLYSIDEHAFSYCSEITNITLPNKLYRIGDNAFTNCDSLCKMTIPASVELMGWGILSFCDKLNNIVLQEGISQIGESVFKDCQALKTISLPSTLSRIGDNAFSNCSSLNQIIIPGSLKEMGASVFYGCKDLSIILQEGITTIDEYAFSDCSGLQSISLPSTLTSIKSFAFSFCSNLRTIIIPESVTDIGWSAFSNSGLEIITLMPGITHISDGAFSGCYDLKEVIFPDSLISIGCFAFEYSSLEQVILPEGTTTIDGAFIECPYLSEVFLPDSIVSMRDAFTMCPSLTSITIPPNVTSISSTFHGCTNLRNVRFEGELTSIDSYAFGYCTSLESIKIPNSVTFIGENAFEECTNLKDINIPDAVTTISNFAFNNCIGLTKIDLPSGLTTIGDCAFFGCTGLESISFPANVAEIIDCAFYNCTSVGEIKFSGNMPKINNHAFYGITAKAYYPAKDPSWTSEGMQNYGGTLNWIKYCTGPHTEVIDEFVPNSCFQNGLTSGSHCSVCGEVLVEQETIPASHNYSSTVTPPTCTHDGYTTYTCTVCGGYYTTDYTEATGHDYGEWILGKQNNCTENGYYYQVCADCRFERTLTTSALGHNFGDWTVGTAPGCESKGQMIRTCASCQETESEPISALGHNYLDGQCTNCKQLDPNQLIVPILELSYPTLSFEDEIFYNVYYTVSDTTSVVEMGLMVLPSRDDSATIDDAISVVPGYITNGTVFLAKSEGVAAANMGDALYFKVYAKLTDGSYAYSTAGGYNAKAYANSILSSNNSDEMKSLVVSMLNYGAQAQLYFGHNTDKLVNNALTTEQQTLVAAYDSSMMDAIVKADTAKTTDFVRVSSNFKQLYPSVSFDSAFAINFYCQSAITVDSGMTLYYWDMATMEAVDKLSLDNATGFMEMVATGDVYWGQVPGIAAKDMDKTYYVTCVFESGGETITTGIIPYTLGKYCTTKADTDGDALQAFAQATAVYGYYAKQYFASIT